MNSENSRALISELVRGVKDREVDDPNVGRIFHAKDNVIACFALEIPPCGDYSEGLIYFGYQYPIAIGFRIEAFESIMIELSAGGVVAEKFFRRLRPILILNSSAKKIASAKLLDTFKRGDLLVVIDTLSPYWLGLASYPHPSYHVLRKTSFWV
jgi:hypothetical protein